NVERLWKAYIKDLNSFLDTKDKGLLASVNSKALTVLKEMNQAVKMMEARAEQAVLSQAWNAVIMILVILFFSFVNYRFVAVLLVSPLQQFVSAFGRGARGDFSEALPDDGDTGEMSQAFRAYNAMIESFSGMVGAVFRSASSVSAMSDQQGRLVESTVLGVRAQHTETDQVAAAMTEMAASVEEVAQNTEHTAEAARTANTNAQEGSRIMTETIGSMDQLRSRVESSSHVITQLEAESKQISSVLEVITSISEQTNLLALNAAIEAARAGEHGRGFAVVADEVRALAAKTKGSTDEINAMIERLQNQVREAVAVMKESQDDAAKSASQASDAGIVLETIVSKIDTITQMTTQIATAAKEQSQVTEELSRNINNISSTSDSTSVFAEQTLEATQDINGKMGELHSHASQFKIKGIDSESAATPASVNENNALF
ncbi:MAG: methyl-accepting chemotaxis protein, partial [Gammaproteobacteria bacterium]|nr:methyl-accepting chemotaxis protein [Gammaproteobacteria bacterium]